MSFFISGGKAVKMLKNQVMILAHQTPDFNKKVQAGKDQEKAQSEKDPHSKNRGGKKPKPTIRYLYHDSYRKPIEQLFSQ